MRKKEGQGTFPILETKRYRLREITQQDANDLFAIYSDPVAMQYAAKEVLTDLQEARDTIERRQERYRAGRFIRWVITEQGDDRSIGTIGFHNWSKQNRSAEMGCDLKRELWGQGIMSELMPVVVEYGFTQMNLNRIVALLSPENIGSRRVLEKAGSLYEGTLRQDLFYQGKFHDNAVYSRLRADQIEQKDQ